MERLRTGVDYFPEVVRFYVDRIGLERFHQHLHQPIEWSRTILRSSVNGVIVKLWVTVRGFSITALWMEMYEKESKKLIKKTPALTKGLSHPTT